MKRNNNNKPNNTLVRSQKTQVSSTKEDEKVKVWQQNRYLTLYDK